MRLRVAIILALLGGMSAFAPSTNAQATQEAPDTERTAMSRTDLARRGDISIRKAVKFLLSRQNPNGSWGEGQPSDVEGGNTALVALALLSSGESFQSPALTRAIQFLKRVHPENTRHATYSIGLRACVYSLLPEALRKSELPADLRWLQRGLIDGGDRKGMYDYGGGRLLGGDYSNSQYGVLGVWYAAEAGLEVPAIYWQKVEDGWLNGQNDDGGWDYMPGRHNSYGSMTAAAIATLYLTNDYLHLKETQDLSKLVINRPLDAAMDWLAKNFAVEHNPGHDDLPLRGQMNQDMLDLLGQLGRSPGFYVHYMLFGYERVGEASGLTRYGTHNWYEEGADYLIRTQAYDGSWTGRIGPEGDTAYSLLFLSRGHSPVVIQKLDFGDRWDNRPRDAASFTRFMRRATERHINWQIVSIDEPASQLRQSPMLYMASDREPDLTPEQKAKLKAYIDQGGLLICVNEGKGNDFTKYITELGEKFYPAYKFHQLTQEHPAYSANFPANYADDPIRALSNGVRELIILYPSGDMSWKWQSAAGLFNPRKTPYATLANLWLYATDRANPRFKGEDPWIERNDGVTADRTVRVFRISHNSNWNPEPGGWERLANIMHDFDQVDLAFDGVPSAPTTRPATNASARATTRPTSQPGIVPDPKRDVLAHLTATRSLQLPAQTKQTLKRYVDGGGLLLFDAAGGSAEASGSFEPLLHELFPGVIIAPLPLDHPIYHATPYGGQEIERVTYRRSTDLTPVYIPRLRGAMVGKKLVAIVSNEDLSGGLVGYSTAGLTGYTSPSATDLMRNIILWRASALK